MTERRLAAIMFTDLVGYVALSQRNEALALELLKEHQELLRPLFTQHHGTEIKTIGDAFLVEFGSAVEAARCAVDIQKALTAHTSVVAPERRIQVRIGLHVGDVVVEGDDVLGDGVNIASRIEPLAEPGGICVSEDVAHQVRNKIDGSLEQLGERKLKGIAEPVTVYRLVLPWDVGVPDLRRPFPARWIAVGVAAAFVLLSWLGCGILFGPDELFGPSIISPDNGAYFTAAESVTYQWHLVEGAANGYRLHVSTDPDFGDKVLNTVTDETVHPGGILSPGPYYLRIKALGRFGKESDWSNTVAFGVEVYKQYIRNTGDGSLQPEMLASLMLAENNLWVAGQTHSGRSRGYLTQLDVSAGPPQVAGQTYSESDTLDYGFVSLDATADGGFILSGTVGDSESLENRREGWVVKVDGAGNKQWSRTFTDTLRELVPAISFQEPGGGYLVAMTRGAYYDEVAHTHSYERVRLEKLDGSGSTEWVQTNVGLRTVVGGRPAMGGAVLFGDILDNTFNTRATLLAVDAAGDLLWTQTYGALFPRRLYSLPSGGWLLLCLTPTAQPVLLVTDSGGNELWRRSYTVHNEFDGTSFGDALDVAVTGEGGYWLLAERNESDAGNGGLITARKILIRTDVIGTELVRYEVPGSIYGGTLYPLQNGGFLIIGWQSIIKTTATGQTLVGEL